jgi:hypothetical protein
MLRQEEYAFINPISMLQFSTALLRKPRMFLSSRKKKKTVVSSGNRITAPGGGLRVSQRPSSQHASKRKTNALAKSGDSMNPANRRPAPGAGSTPLPAISSVTGEIAAVVIRQIGPPE